MKTAAERRKQQTGLSLLELMVVSSILSVFSIFMVNLLMVTQNALSIQNTGTPVRTEAKLAMEYMAKELREADPGAPLGINGGNGQITFYKPYLVTQAGVQSWCRVQFQQVGQEVRRTQDGAPGCPQVQNELIGRNVALLQFAVNADVVTATVQTSMQGKMGTIQSTLTSQIKLRN